MAQLSLHTARYRLDIELDDRTGRCVLTDNYSGVAFADSDYCYQAAVEHAEKIVVLDGLWNPEVTEESPDRGGRIVTISGRLGAAGSGVEVDIRHRFYLPDDDEFFDEQILLRNPSEKHLALRGYRFGFRKQLQPSVEYGGAGIDIENYRAIAIPFRLQPDGKKHDYHVDDLYHGRYQCSEYANRTSISSEIVDRGQARSEAWAWTDGEHGLLMLKYNPAMIEYSMLDTERTDDGARYLVFGGAAPALYDEPSEAVRLGPGLEVGFGQTHYQFYEGLWRRGAYIFKDYLAGLGHGLPDDYNPPVVWSLPAQATSLADIEKEAAAARDIGCEALQLGSEWENERGNSIWDTTRLGAVGSFVERMRDQYGLQTGIRVIGRSYHDGYPDMYSRTYDGHVGYYAADPQKPFYEPCVVFDECKQEMLRRLQSLADAGVSFMVFDEFDWRGACFHGRHGHKVPTTPDMHARAVISLIRGIREHHPNLLTELHDPVWPWGVGYLPIYYLHDYDRTFHEGWSFQLASSPLENLLSGESLSLFYYRLAYDLPLYMPLDMDADNDQCLAFWWYVSTIKHIGICGGRTDKRRQAYKQALAQYLSMKELYVNGEFHGLDELTHFHVLEDTGHCVLNAFNLTDAPISRSIELPLADMGLMAEVEVEGARAEMTGSKLWLELNIEPFSPLVVRIYPRD